MCVFWIGETLAVPKSTFFPTGLRYRRRFSKNEGTRDGGGGLSSSRRFLTVLPPFCAKACGKKVLFGTASVSSIQKALLFHECSHAHRLIFVFYEKNRAFLVVLSDFGRFGSFFWRTR